MIDLPAIFAKLQPFLPFLGIAFAIALLATPLIAKLAFKIGALDLPGYLRNRNDRTAERRIHDRIVPKLTGLVLMLPVILVLLSNNQFKALPWGIFAGGFVLLIAGIIDDKFDISGRQQLLFQIVAAILVVVSGVSITYIEVLGIDIDLAQLGVPILQGAINYTFLFPADLITVFWIVAVINFIGWSDGVDGVHGAVAIIAISTLLLITLRSPSLLPSLVILISLLLGSNLGFYPFNFEPAKMFYGGSGTYINGFFLAVIAIMSTSKLATSIIILGLPIFDAILVIYLRTKANPEVLRNPLKILSISDKNHLHHRLLDVGYSKRMVLLVEVTMMLVLCLIALFFVGLENDSLAIVGALVITSLIFTLIAFGRKRAERIRIQVAQEQEKQPKVEVRYAQPEVKKEEVEKFKY